jgi:DNA polymerase-3 subunit delta
MRSLLLDGEIREDNLLACYFFHGEEMFLAQQFIRDLKKTLITPDLQNISMERFALEETHWREILDVARTMPFFFSPWRILVVEISAADTEELTAAEQKSLKDYFDSPTARTVFVVCFAGKVRKSKPLFKVFSSLPSSVAFVKELKPLKNEALFTWVDGKLAAAEKRVTSEAVDRLLEVTGNDLQSLDSELEKLVTYVGEKKVIELADVNQASDWVKNFFEWELAASLEQADLKQSLVILNTLFTEGAKPEYILGVLGSFFRDILMAKAWLREKKKDKREIFRELKPRISEKYGKFYMDKFREFFSLVERLTQKELLALISDLEQMDLKIKTTDVEEQTLFESFFYEYCRGQKKEGITWQGRD